MIVAVATKAVLQSSLCAAQRSYRRTHHVDIYCTTSIQVMYAVKEVVVVVGPASEHTHSVSCDNSYAL